MSDATRTDKRALTTGAQGDVAVLFSDDEANVRAVALTT
jgi:hypothetical protein